MHIKNIFDEGELSEVSVCKDFLHTATDGKKYNTKSYNLDLIISLGYRIKSDIATKFRQWATERLHEYLVKGFTMNDEFLKENGGVSKKDIVIAKNYLNEKELKVLNNIVSAFFDLAEVRVMEHKPMYMKDWIAQLDKLISVFDKKVLTEAGSVSHAEALKKAEAEYKKFQAKTLSPVEKAYLENIKLLEKKVEKKNKR